MFIRTLLAGIAVFSFASIGWSAEDPVLPAVKDVARQPLAAQARAITQAMEFLGTPLDEPTKKLLQAAYDRADDAGAAAGIQSALDPLCLLAVEINPESRVKVTVGPAKPELSEGGWKTFLVKVHNQAGVNAELQAASEEALPLPNAAPNQLSDRWMDLSMFTGRPLSGPKLSGLELEYRIIQIYSRDAGKRSANIAFNVGRHTQDLGFRGEATILFTAARSNNLTFKILDENGRPATAGLIIKDKQGHVYPSQAKRLAPDFFFQPQIYRADGETLKLPNGTYTIVSSRGPEYLASTQRVTIDNAPQSVTIRLKRWIDPVKFGYYSGDHHIHAAGCAHYSNPTQGVFAKDMVRQTEGEDLKVGCNLTWGPCFDFQKQFFTGKDDPVSRLPYLLRYDVEVSGFGSHQSGHLCLLRLKNMIYPGGDSDKHWPTLGLNTLKWAKKQGAITGPAHSGNGIHNKDGKLPSYLIPDYNGIGANEYIVDITHEVPGPDGKPVPPIDFISTVDTEPQAELNMWYHTLNCGFRIRASGETDFPCITGERVGMGRSYVKLTGGLNYSDWCEGIKAGRNYVSEGHSHIIDMKLNDTEMGVNGSELRLPAQRAGGALKLTAKVAAYLPEEPSAPKRSRIPWQIEKARIPGTRNVKVEAIVDGRAVAEKIISADGALQDITFDDIKLDRSGWVAMRIFPSSHSNPIFVIVDGQPIRASKRSARWCLDGVDQCWKSKSRTYAAAEQAEAKAAYEHARQVYRKIIEESPVD